MGCEYDVDLVCLINLAKTSITQRELKDMIGAELRLGWPKELSPRRRCWTLSFPRKFHLDVLPAIPDLKLPPTGILLTDRELHFWQHSDPTAYALWFESRMAMVFQEFKLQLAQQLRASVADVPNWRVRTPLQRVVQILKRHRDVFFANELDVRPASIILTTFAARLYRGQTSIAAALSDTVTALPTIPRRLDGEYEILNPVNPKENFADMWNEDPSLPRAFFRWVSALREDLERWLEPGAGLYQLSSSLNSRFGEAVVNRALPAMGIHCVSLAVLAHWRWRRAVISLAPAPRRVGRACRPTRSLANVDSAPDRVAGSSGAPARGGLPRQLREDST